MGPMDADRLDNAGELDAIVRDFLRSSRADDGAFPTGAPRSLVVSHNPLGELFMRQQQDRQKEVQCKVAERSNIHNGATKQSADRGDAIIPTTDEGMYVVSSTFVTAVEDESDTEVMSAVGTKPLSYAQLSTLMRR